MMIRMDCLGLGRGPLRTRAALVGLGCAAAMLVTAPDAAAQSRISFGDGFIGCSDYVFCETDAECDGSDACTFVETYEGSYCLTSSGSTRDIVCCDPEAATPCPDLGSGAGTCVELTAETHVCRYPDDDRVYCLESGSGDTRLATLRKCFTSPGSVTASRSWADGDCDADGIKNSLEHEGCVCLADATCGVTVDAGVVDAGSEEEDAGAEERDAGSEEEDAGVEERDAGEPNRMDGGKPDEEPVEDPLQGIDFRGSGGCSCDAGGGDGFPPAAAIAVLLGAALARRARRRR